MSVIDFNQAREARRPPSYAATATIKQLRILAAATFSDLEESLAAAEQFAIDMTAEMDQEQRGYLLHRLSEIGTALAKLALEADALYPRRLRG